MIATNLYRYVKYKEITMNTEKTIYKHASLREVKIHYREAGSNDAPVLLLLHGFPSSSHMFRNLMPLLADKFHLIAPDLPGFGMSDSPDHKSFQYTFDHLADVMDEFVHHLGLTRFSMYVFDYGAPVGFRLAMRNPDAIAGIISQNGNTYEEGLSDGWEPLRTYWAHPTAENRESLRQILTLDSTKFQYFEGVSSPERIAPDGYLLDQYFLEQPGHDEIQLDLLGDYGSNVKLYPKIQEYLRQYQPPLLAIWGKRDPYFLPAGAEAFKKDLSGAKVHLLDTGHFALETHSSEIAVAIASFMNRINRL